MVAAIFEMESMWGPEKHFFEGESASDLLAQFERVQDLGCLARMGRMQGPKKDQKELDKLDALLEKYYADELTMEDLKKFSIKLSLGKLSVTAIAETDEEIEKIREQFTKEIYESKEMLPHMYDLYTDDEMTSF